MGPMTLPDIGHNARVSDFPEIDKIPDHPDREVLFLEDGLLNRTLQRRETARSKYQVMRDSFQCPCSPDPNMGICRYVHYTQYGHMLIYALYTLLYFTH